MGGLRDVPVPDSVARDYLLIALWLDRHVPGIVDGYFGPADLRAQVHVEQLRPPRLLADDAARLRGRLTAEVGEPDRRRWLDLQLRALETLALVQAGEPIPYLETVRRCFAQTPARRPLDRFEGAAARLDLFLPGQGSLHDRLAAENAAWTVPPEHIEPLVDELLPRLRARAATLFGLPEGEAVDVSLVRDRPWSAYNWYDGGFRSRVDINLDLPVRLPGLLGTLAHETYPGHHLEHATKERTLVEGLGRMEASVLLINTPESLVSEGLANVGRDVAVPPSTRDELLVELAGLAGIPLAAHPEALREAAAREGEIAAARAILDESRVNAALMLHHDGRPRDEVLGFLVEAGRYAPAAAAKQLQFMEHPLWRTYVFVYPEGEALIRRWLELAPPGARAARFGRLLREPLTPPAIEAEIASAG